MINIKESGGTISKTEEPSPSLFGLAFIVLYCCLQFYTTITISNSGGFLLLLSLLLVVRINKLRPLPMSGLGHYPNPEA